MVDLELETRYLTPKCMMLTIIVIKFIIFDVRKAKYFIVLTIGQIGF